MENKWISVKDRLPESYVDVLVYGKTTDGRMLRSVDYMRILKNPRKRYWGNGEVVITHWMSLPDLPNE